MTRRRQGNGSYYETKVLRFMNRNNGKKKEIKMNKKN